MRGDENLSFREHIGGGHYISVTSGYKCVDFRQWYHPYSTEDGTIKPTKKGVTLRLDEWSGLCTLTDTINDTYPTLGSAQPCYYQNDHMNQEGWLQCTECHPFLNITQKPAS